jgi:hypothetical protein
MSFLDTLEVVSGIADVASPFFTSGSDAEDELAGLDIGKLAAKQHGAALGSTAPVADTTSKSGGISSLDSLTAKLEGGDEEEETETEEDEGEEEEGEEGEEGEEKSLSGKLFQAGLGGLSGVMLYYLIKQLEGDSDLISPSELAERGRFGPY